VQYCQFSLARKDMGLGLRHHVMSRIEVAMHLHAFPETLKRLGLSPSGNLVCFPQTIQRIAVRSARKPRRNRGRLVTRGREISRTFDAESGFQGLRVPSYREEYHCVLKYFFDHNSSTSVVSNFADTVALSGVTDYARYTAMFDQFRINLVEIWIQPNYTYGYTGERGVLISAVDINDSAAPTIAALEASNSSLETGSQIGHYHRFVPCIQDDGTSVNTWVTCGSPSTAWYGLKSSMAVSTNVIYYHYFIRMHVTFRGQQA